MTELPRTAVKIRELAEANDWRVETTTAKEPDRAVLWFRRDGAKVYAQWQEGRFTGAGVKWPVLLPLIQRDLKELLATPVEEFGFGEWPPDLPDDPKQMIRDEYEMCGFYISGHPLDHVNMRRYPDVVDAAILLNEDTLDEAGYRVGARIQILGIVEEPQVKKTRRTGAWIAFFGVSDLTGVVRCFGFGEEFREMKAGALVHVKGVIEERDGGLQVIARNVQEVSW